MIGKDVDVSIFLDQNKFVPELKKFDNKAVPKNFVQCRLFTRNAAKQNTVEGSH